MRQAVHPLTKQLIERKARGEKLAVLTAYDYPTARLLDEAGVDMMLVGDSLGMVVLGLPDTTGVDMNAMLHHAAAVRRAVKRAPVVVDLPAHSYDVPERALHNAERLVRAGADAVKLEGGRAVIEQVRAITAGGHRLCRPHRHAAAEREARRRLQEEREDRGGRGASAG